MGCPDQCNCVKCRRERRAISRTTTATDARDDTDADDAGPDPDVLAQRRRELERQRGSSLTERDIEKARMSTQEQLLEAIEALTDTGTSGATLRKQELAAELADLRERLDMPADGAGDGDSDAAAELLADGGRE